MALLSLVATDRIEVGEGPAYEYHAEDGIGMRFDYYIEVVTGGKIFTLLHAFRQREAAARLARVVRSRGVLDLDFWLEREVMDLETKWDLYAEHEWEVNHGFRAPHDLYHGIPL